MADDRDRDGKYGEMRRDRDAWRVMAQRESRIVDELVALILKVDAATAPHGLVVAPEKPWAKVWQAALKLSKDRKLPEG